MKEEVYISRGTSYAAPNESACSGAFSQVELMVIACDNIQKNIKAANTVIMCSDIKDKLKRASKEIELIKRKIAHGRIFEVSKLNFSDDLDEEDKAFIMQTCLDTKHEISGRSDYIRRKTLVDLVEKQTETPLFDVGTDQFDISLNDIGNN